MTYFYELPSFQGDADCYRRVHEKFGSEFSSADDCEELEIARQLADQGLLEEKHIPVMVGNQQKGSRFEFRRTSA